jgi:DNA-binding NarL/FixJ family response regulator
MINVLLAEDQKVLRESLKIILTKDPEITVIGCAADGSEALAIVEEKLPDIILMDIKMPVCDGLECTRLLKEKHPQIKIVILTTFDNDENVEKALAYGADGYILKEIDPEEIISIIKNTMKGLQVIHHDAYSKILKQFHMNKLKSEDNPPNIDLTEREIDIIRLIVQGKSNREIAVSLLLSETRVKSLITQILKKFNVEDRTQLAVYALKNNIIDNKFIKTL